MARPQAVISHWAKLLEGFHASPLDFYTMIERAVGKRNIPDIEISRVDWREGGALSAKREYFRVRRGPHAFDVCGAPFGTGFFVSSWFARMEAPPILPMIIAGFVATLLFGSVLIHLFDYLVGTMILIMCLPLMLKLFVMLMHDQPEGWDDGLVAIPYFGPVYEFLFRPETYYKMDTAQMFQQSIHNAVMEALDELTAGSGVRYLSEHERIPIAMAARSGR